MLKDVNVDESSRIGYAKPGLPQQTDSLCPECLSQIAARIYEDAGKVWMRKTCPSHGEFTELLSSDAAFYKRLDGLDWSDARPEPDKSFSPLTPMLKGCPQDCGLCAAHSSSTMMTVMDITNRCNLRCPVCFANAAVAGRVCELPLERIKELIAASIAANKAGAPCIQFSGGEPTIHPQFLQAVREAKRGGYAQIQIASNGLAFAQDPAYAAAASEAGLNVVYLQFDGVDDAVYTRTRGRPLWDLKQKAVDSIRKAGMEIMLVPTLIKGVNDHQIGDIFRFAVANSDTVVGISWQPVAFVGRIEHAERIARRFTMADLARELERQTGGRLRMDRDWYPLSFVAPFSRLLEALTHEAHPTITCHRHCGAGNYVFVDPATLEYKPITAFLNVEGLMEKMNRLADVLSERRWFRKYTLMKALKDLNQFFDPDQALPGWGDSELTNFLVGFADFRKQYPDNAARKADLLRQRYRPILLVAMHFQDVYNFELPRVRQCVIHYIAADGKMYPFCTYNGGPSFRERVENRYAWSRRKEERPAPAWAPVPQAAGNV
jgi:7,8-dihydro-6-hydroxymethylpterin dimethyltransferase